MPEIEAQREAAYAALGKFISAFTLVETQLHYMLRDFSGMTDAASRLIFAGMRNHDVIKHIRALLDISTFNKEYKTRILDALDQINLLNELRTTLVHRQTYAEGDKIMSMNLLTAKRLNRTEPTDDHVLHFSLEELRRATSDLATIDVQLAIILGQIRVELNLQDKPAVMAILNYAWQYKPAAQARQGKAHPPKKR